MNGTSIALDVACMETTSMMVLIPWPATSAMCGSIASAMASHQNKLHETISCSSVTHAKRGMRMRRSRKYHLSSWAKDRVAAPKLRETPDRRPRAGQRTVDCHCTFSNSWMVSMPRSNFSLARRHITQIVPMVRACRHRLILKVCPGRPLKPTILPLTRLHTLNLHSSNGEAVPYHHPEDRPRQVTLVLLRLPKAADLQCNIRIRLSTSMHTKTPFRPAAGILDTNYISLSSHTAKVRSLGDRRTLRALPRLSHNTPIRTRSTQLYKDVHLLNPLVSQSNRLTGLALRT
jgi:hypothetical protein